MNVLLEAHVDIGQIGKEGLTGHALSNKVHDDAWAAGLFQLTHREQEGDRVKGEAKQKTRNKSAF